MASPRQPGRPKAQLVLTGAERDQLARWARRPRTAQALALRAAIVLACAQGADNKVVAAQLRVREATVARWRRRSSYARVRPAQLAGAACCSVEPCLA